MSCSRSDGIFAVLSGSPPLSWADRFSPVLPDRVFPDGASWGGRLPDAPWLLISQSESEEEEDEEDESDDEDGTGSHGTSWNAGASGIGSGGCVGGKYSVIITA